MTSKYLKNFEELNTTTDSIYDLGDNQVLIILKDGTNLTDWEDVDEREDVLYVSEDLSDCTNLMSKYRWFSYLEAVVASNVTAKVTKLVAMFDGCWRLKEVSPIDWDISGVTDMSHMFANCDSLEDFSFLSDWDVSNVNLMEFMFNSCESMMDLSALSDWNVCNVRSMDDMFGYCANLEDISALSEWDVSNLASAEGLFFYCTSLRDVSALSNWDVSKLNEWGIGGMFEGCYYGLDLSFFKDLNHEALWDRSWNFAGWR